MYENFYKLSGRPFQLMPDPRLLFKSRDHSRALSYLLYGLERREGFVVITGGVGMGKTLLIQTLLGEPRVRHVAVGRLAMANLDADAVLPAVASAFGLPHKARSKIELLDGLVSRVLPAQSRGALLIIDEAQTCSAEALEELRALSNLQSNGRALLQIFLIGQTDLRDILARPEMTHLRQRVVASHQLQPLSADEVREYVRHRLGAVGWQDDPDLAESVYALAHEWSGGVPRRVNLLMDRLLLHGYLEQCHELGEDDIRLVISEFEEEFETAPIQTTSATMSATPSAGPATAPAPQEFSDLGERLASLERAVVGLLGTGEGGALLDRHAQSASERELLAAQSRIARLEGALAELNQQSPVPSSADAAPSTAAADAPELSETTTTSGDWPPGQDDARVQPAGEGTVTPNGSAAPLSLETVIDSIRPANLGPANTDDEADDEDDHTARWRLFSRRRRGEH